MPVPKRKVSKSRRDQRSANKGITPGTFTLCSHCGVALNQHTVCKECGYYKGKKVLKTKADRALSRQDMRAKQAAKKTDDHAGHDHEGHTHE